MTPSRTILLLLPLLPVLAAAPAVRAQGLNQPPPGYRALFNGKDLTNWKGLIELPQRSKLTPEQLAERQKAADEQMRAHWSVENGILIYDGKGNSLQTARDYRNFELYVDWKIQKDGDSGIYLRGNPQVQIWDPATNPVGSGGLFNNQKNPSKPTVVADRPVGEWNTFWIRMVGDRVTVKLNGVTVVDRVPLENYWERGKPLPDRGPIELQHHGNRLEFRNIFIKELPDDLVEQAGVARPIRSARAGSGKVTLTLKDIPVVDALKALAAQAQVSMLIVDRNGVLDRRVLPFVSLSDVEPDRAVALLCRAAGVEWKREPDGTFVVTGS